MDLLNLSAGEIADLVSRREVSAVEVVTQSLQAIDDARDSRAFLAVASETAFSAAREADARAASGTGGLLNGVPVAVKDLSAVRGMPNSFGLAAYRDNFPDADSAMVERLRAAGAVIVGKTNTPALGTLGETMNRLGMDCTNPWDVSRTSGGSSGGSAAAVACGMVPVATGTDYGGSITGPAAMCGIFGIKPSHGRVSTWPAGEGSGLLNDLGPLTRTVRDAALMLQVMAGPDPRDPMCLRQEPPFFAQAVDDATASDRPLVGIRIAWSPDLGHFPVDSDLIEVVSQALSVLESLGASISADEPRISNPFTTFMPISVTDTRLALRGFSPTAREELFPETIAELDEYPDIPATEYVVVLSQLWQLRAAVAEFFDRYDLMVMPATAVPAFPLRQPPTRIGLTDVKPGWTTAMPFSVLWNMTGQPTASVPCGLTAEGLPVGLMVVGRKGAEIDVLRASAALEMAMPWSTQTPRLRWSSTSS